MLAAYIMRTGVATLKGEALAGEALKYLEAEEASGDGVLAVTGEDGGVIGLLSLKGLLDGFLNRDRPGGAAVTAERLTELAHRPVREFMSKSFLMVSPLEPVESVAGSFTNSTPPPEAVFVVDDRGLLLGLIESGDIRKRCLDYLER